MAMVWEALAQTGIQTPTKLGWHGTREGAKQRLETYAGGQLLWSDQLDLSLAALDGGTSFYQARRVSVPDQAS